jgi:hypothetical protein
MHSSTQRAWNNSIAKLQSSAARLPQFQQLGQQLVQCLLQLVGLLDRAMPVLQPAGICDTADTANKEDPMPQYRMHKVPHRTYMLLQCSAVQLSAVREHS